MSTIAAILHATDDGNNSTSKSNKRRRTPTTTDTPWEAMRFASASAPTEAAATRVIQAYGLETDTKTFIKMVLMGQVPEDTSGGIYESNLARNGCGGFESVPVGTHYIFTIGPYNWTECVPCCPFSLM